MLLSTGYLCRDRRDRRFLLKPKGSFLDSKLYVHAAPRLPFLKQTRSTNKTATDVTFCDAFDVTANSNVISIAFINKVSETIDYKCLFRMQSRCNWRCH